MPSKRRRVRPIATGTTNEQHDGTITTLPIEQQQQRGGDYGLSSSSSSSSSSVVIVVARTTTAKR
jgi:hypothetical protein